MALTILNLTFDPHHPLVVRLVFFVLPASPTPLVSCLYCRLAFLSRTHHRCCAYCPYHMHCPPHFLRGRCSPQPFVAIFPSLHLIPSLTLSLPSSSAVLATALPVTLPLLVFPAAGLSSFGHGESTVIVFRTPSDNLLRAHTRLILPLPC